MNQLNETIRALRTQITVEEMNPEPDLERLKILGKSLHECLEQYTEGTS